MALITLAAGDYVLTVDPDIGGSVRSLAWRGQPVLRQAAGDSVLDAACFPLVPFSNRIARGRFRWDGRDVALAPNFPGHDHPHPLHGFGWTSHWTVVSVTPSRLAMEHAYPGGEWPWPYLARQTLSLTQSGVTLTLAVHNRADRPMPAGLGFHPYFPRTERTILRSRHLGECVNDRDCLPRSIKCNPVPIDWWNGDPVGSRCVDTVYVGREGPIAIMWPERGIQLRLDCDPFLAHTAILVPDAEDWFCVEPVSHMTNAVNVALDGQVMPSLAPGATLEASIHLEARAIPADRLQG